MHTKEEVKEDLDKIRDLIDQLEVKYGPEFSCAVSVGTGVHTELTSDDEPDAFAGATCIMGNEAMFHQTCHCLLQSAKFVDGIIDAISCVIVKHHREKGMPEELDKLMALSMNSIKKLLIECTYEYKKSKADKEASEIVDDFLSEIGMKN